MENELIKLMQDQERDLSELLELLETQYKMIMSKDVFGLEGLVDELGECGKKIAKKEVKRRELLGEESIKNIISKSNNEELNSVYNDIRDTINKLILKKDTNDMLLKQELLFNSKMLSLINPNREKKTYNAYGKLK